MLSLSHQGTPNPDNSNETSTSTIIGERQQHGPSEYEMRQQANIADNQQLLDSLGLSEGGSSVMKKPLTKVKKAKGNKEKRCAFCLFCSAFLNMIQLFSRLTDDHSTSIADQACPTSQLTIQPGATVSNDDSPGLSPGLSPGNDG